MVFNVYSDPSHGWAKVSRQLLQELNILDRISSYSYQRKDYVYLEEDCDLSLLVETLQSKGIKFSFKEYHGNKTSRIRNYPRFVA
jgi:hypothetical protein